MWFSETDTCLVVLFCINWLHLSSLYIHTQKNKGQHGSIKDLSELDSAGVALDFNEWKRADMQAHSAATLTQFYECIPNPISKSSGCQTF